MDTAGRPLIYWTIKAAQQSQYLDAVMCSTDCREIAKVANDFECDVPFLRPAQLAADETCSVDVVHDLLVHFSNYDYVTLLQPTSPLRTVEDIDRALELRLATKANSVVSVTKTTEHPAWMYHLHQDGLTPVLNHSATRRQDLPNVYQLNGAIYIAQVDWFMQHGTFMDEFTLPFEMPAKRSIDIDEFEDWVIADYYLNSRA